VVEVDVVNSSLSSDDRLTFPRQQHPQHGDDGDDVDGELWKKSLGFIRLRANSLAAAPASAGNN